MKITDTTNKCALPFTKENFPDGSWFVCADTLHIAVRWLPRGARCDVVMIEEHKNSIHTYVEDADQSYYRVDVQQIAYRRGK